MEPTKRKVEYYEEIEFKVPWAEGNLIKRENPEVNEENSVRGIYRIYRLFRSSTNLKWQRLQKSSLISLKS